MGAFSVAVPAVDALSFRVAAAASDVRSAEGKLAANSCLDTGYGDLSGALSSFQEFWQSFTDGAAQSVEGTASSIAAAAASYQSVDSHVIADPGLTSAFVNASVSGNDGLAQLLIGPLVGGGGPPAAPTTPGLSGLPGLPAGGPATGSGGSP